MSKEGYFRRTAADTRSSTSAGPYLATSAGRHRRLLKKSRGDRYDNSKK
jgi:hypothetical protein